MQYPKLVESKTTTNEVTTIEWTPGMDLLATVFSNGSLTCSRLLSLQKVWNTPSCGKVISIAWRPDGRVLAIGSYNENTKVNACTLHDVEDGRELNSITTKDEITSVAWFDCNPVDEQKPKEDPIRVKKVTTVDSPVTEHFSHQLAHKQNQLNILLITTGTGLVSFYGLGLFYLGQFDVHSIANSKIIRTHMSSCMRYLATVAITPSQSRVTLANFNTFHERGDEILRVAKMYAKITDELEYLDDTLSAITTSWTDVLAGLDNKLSSYCSRKTTNQNETRSNYTFISADDLLQLLVLGTPSDNLEKFLADMSDKGLRKLNNAIEQTCLRVQNLIVRNAQKCCYHLHNDLNMLRGMALWRERFSAIGLDDKSIVKAMRDVGSLVLKLTELQQVIDHSVKSTKSFFRWLISIACRLGGEQNNSNVAGDVNKTTQQDTQLITDFILENFDYNSNQDDLASFLSKGADQSSQLGDSKSGDRPTCSNFTLGQVGQYFKNEPLGRLKYSFTKPESNFWIDFFQQKPEIIEPQLLEDGSSVLLFYPHNPDTSLVQEHKRTCKSIEEAFKCVAKNINRTILEIETSSSFSALIKNAPTDRIRVEMDTNLKRLYALFQLKSGPVNKQYFISQCLVDQSFKLISLEFQSSLNTSRMTSSRASCISSTLAIADSSFYQHKETRKMYLFFLLLDQTLGDTVIVQIELNKLLERANCTDRSRRDLSKIFRFNDSIDKYSTHVILKLDLNTYPAQDRKHEPEMMVKKIKGVVGKDMYPSSSRGVIAFTSCDNKRIHLYELESPEGVPEIMDDEEESEETVDESLIDTDMMA